MQLMMPNPKYLRRIPPFKRIFDSLQISANNIFKYIDERIEEHTKNNEENEQTDFVGRFLAEKERRDKLGVKHFYT